MAANLRVALLFCTFLPTVDGLSSEIASNLTLRSKAGDGSFTQNSLCRQNNCVNPIFPGLNDLPRLEALTWQCSTQNMAQEYMNFCKNAVIYDPALPSPVSKATPINQLVKAQEDAAMTMYVYHLSGMGYDAWDYQSPSESDNDCVRSIWKMVCYTYFPRANAGCKQGEVSLYQRPCRSCCHNYLAHCGVECCDESVQCSFTSTKTNTLGKVEILQTGYVDADGPSAQCTGGARRTLSTPFFLILGIFGIHLAVGANDIGQASRAVVEGRPSRFWRHFPVLVLLAAIALSLQGCDSEGIAHHSVGNWRAKPNYLNEYRFLPPGTNARNSILNSCAKKGVAPSLQCSGRGFCKAFSTEAAPEGLEMLAFCSCDPGWADPECGTPRKSQMKAFFISICFGMFGGDYFYLGYPLFGMGKLLTLGGLGFWWLIDIVRIGSGPVYAYNFRTAHDLPHSVAMLILVFLCLFLGFFAAIESYLMYRKKRRDDIAMLEHSEEASAFAKTKAHLVSTENDGVAQRRKRDLEQHHMSGYGATLPLPHPNAGAPYAAAAPGMEMF